ncbi:MAG: hypothetical protein JXA19_02205 [Anaerolineales bacterium]|nr:hypothetical protein [Anaerolineales bacterium]
MNNSSNIEIIINDSLNQPFSGWDFSFLSDRMLETPPPWDYQGKVIAAASTAVAMLDMDTGGGEFLAGLPHRPPLTAATENWLPNLPVARERLNPLGVEVLPSPDGEFVLPFEDQMFDLVINRHGSYSESEVFRVLQPGGFFITQQVGCRNCVELNQFLCPQSLEKIDFTWTADRLGEQLISAGFSLQICAESRTLTRFLDIGALVYYLKVISWQIEGFLIRDNFPVMEKMHDYMELHDGFNCYDQRYLLIAQKPG